MISEAQTLFRAARMDGKLPAMLERRMHEWLVRANQLLTNENIRAKVEEVT